MSLGPNAEALLRSVISAADGQIPASRLLDRIERTGHNRANATNIVTRAHGVGFLIRTGYGRNYSYRINPNYDRADRGVAAQPEPAALPRNDGLQLPAFGSTPLAAHLGIPAGDEEELPPVVGYAYRDTTRRIFDQAFRDIE